MNSVPSLNELPRTHDQPISREFATPCLVDLSGSNEEAGKGRYTSSEAAQVAPQTSKPKSARQRARVRCQSADSQSQSTRRAKNWFTPSETRKNRNAGDHLTREGDQTSKQSPEQPQERVMTPSSLRKSPSSHTKPESSTHAVDAPYAEQFSCGDDPQPLPQDLLEGVSIDDPSFYYLELRLEHPESLSAWRFHAVFTDLSAPSRPSVVLDELCVSDPAVL